MKLNPDETSAILFAVKADELSGKGKITEAIKICKKGIRVYPDYPAAYLVLSELYVKKKRRRTALRLLNEGSKEFPDSILIKEARFNALRADNSIYHYIIKPISLAVSSVVLVIFLSISFVPAAFPDFSSGLAESLRSFLSPLFVAKLEELSFNIEDKFNEVKLSFGDKQQIEFSDLSIGNFSTMGRVRFNGKEGSEKSGFPDSLIKSKEGDSIIKKTAGSIPDSGWIEIPSAGSEPIMYRMKMNPDPDKPYAQVFFIKILCEKVNLHLGLNGKIPLFRQTNRLIAGFNGGFRYVHGNYGLKTEFEEVHPPKNNIGTLVVYKNGSYDIVKWTAQHRNDSSIIAYRQNCPLMLENGGVTKDIKKSQAVWGFTIDNKALTWRSGIGISRDKKWLYYGFGKSLTVASLATAFKAIGASNAIQLDINAGWTKFVLFRHDDGIKAQKLIYTSNIRKYEYLQSRDNASNGRDFFYLTLK